MVTVLKEGFDARAAAQKVKLICLDLDGTLCARDKSIPAANADAIRRAREAGITVAVASGRHPFNVRELMDGLGLPFCAVCLSGAIAVLDGETVFAHPLPIASVESAIGIACEQGAYISVAGAAFNCCCGDIDRGPEKKSAAVARYGRLDSYDELVACAREHEGEILKCSLHAETDAAYVELRDALSGMEGVEVAQPDVRWADVNARGCSKLEGIDALARAMGLDISEVAAVGDDENDVQSLGGVGLGIAMGNAVEAARATALVQVGTNDEAGVAEAIDMILVAR